jgi:hypothetical protein
MLRTPALDRGMAQAEVCMKTDTDPDYIPRVVTWGAAFICIPESSIAMHAATMFLLT